MEQYKKWDDIPSNLKTKTQLRQNGLKLAPNQEPIAQKIGGKGPFVLYDEVLAVPINPITEAQLNALKKAHLSNCCKDCGEKFDKQGPYRKYREGYCWVCWQKQQAISIARDILIDKTSIILDTETTGLTNDAQIVEIAIISITSEILLNTLVKPTEPIPQKTIDIHGIDNIAVANAPTWYDVWAQVPQIFEKSGNIIIYNASFDVRMMRQSFEANKMSLPDDFGNLPFVCAMELYSEYVNHYYAGKGFKWWPLNGGHRALGDCLATLELIKKMA